tara:strand:+ start:2834 stop:3286 length:453 start_codon:yes stop_codon:yes gene_type:complete
VKKKKAKIIIGSTDVVDLPELELENIPCKIDTGAYTSALHCTRVRIIEKDDQTYLSFRLYDPKFGIHNKKEYRFKDFKEKRVRSSNGEVDYRYTITTTVVLFDQKIKTAFTLSFREKMKYPILLGKRLLKNHFIVDVSQDDLNLKQKNKK